MITIEKHWKRLKRSLSKRYKEWMLPKGYSRLGTRYGGWWIDVDFVGPTPLLIDCGLGEDISFPIAFINRFGGQVIGIEPNPRSLAYCQQHCPPCMKVYPLAFWTTAGTTVTFHLPRSPDQLPNGADGVSGSLLATHEYVHGGKSLNVLTTNLYELLASVDRNECDVLKLDIEGAEFEVLLQLCQSGDIRRARQVLVEFHHRVTHHSLDETINSVAAIESAGFQLVHVEGRNYVFRRSGPL